MKTPLFYFLIALSWQCSQPTASAQIPNSNFSKKIKTIETYQVNPESGDKNHKSSEHFDKDENLVKSLNYNSYPNNDTHEQNCTYDAQGNTKCITTDESGTQFFFYEKKMDGENMVEEKSTYGTTKFSYDKNNHLILKEEYDEEGNFSKAEKYEVIYRKGTTDLKGKITFQKEGNGDFKKFDETFYTYENGQLKEENYTTDYYKYDYFYEYHSNGNLKEKTTLNGKKEKVITQYYKNGKRRIEAIFRSKEVGSEMILVQKNKWTYDKYDNEVMFESFRNDKLTKKRISEITYY